MVEPLPPEVHPLADVLGAFYLLVAQEPRQPLNQLAEEAVVHWIRVLDGHDVVQPRVNARGYAPSAFHFGMAPEAEQRLDRCDLPAPAGGLAALLAPRLERLRTELEAYFDQSGYRSSADRCDRMLLSLVRLSRVLNTWAGDAEAAHRHRWRGRVQAAQDSVQLYVPEPPQDRLGEARWHLVLWEPLLNAAIVAWEENQLDWFDRALRELLERLRQSPAERAQALLPPGYPLRRLGLPRQRVMDLAPEQRPLRSRSVLWVRHNQLLEYIAYRKERAAPLLEELAEDVRHLMRMAEANRFLLAASPGFYERGRAGVPVIRGRPTAHPFLLDPIGFFKKAVLFHNGTYTVAGGGMDVMYLQLRQLERLCKFEHWAGWTRPLRTPLQACLIAWEENRRAAFTEGLLAVADQFRRRAEAPSDVP